MMEIKLDKLADALYIKLKKGKVHKTKTVNGCNSLLDLNSKGEVIGIEILNYSKSIPEKSGKQSIIIGKKQILLPA